MGPTTNPSSSSFIPFCPAPRPHYSWVVPAARTQRQPCVDPPPAGGASSWLALEISFKGASTCSTGGTIHQAHSICSVVGLASRHKVHDEPCSASGPCSICFVMHPNMPASSVPTTPPTATTKLELTLLILSPKPARSRSSRLHTSGKHE